LPAMQGAGVETAALGELIGRYPGWARGIAALGVSEQTAQETARALADQLTHDPFLGQAVHSMLTRISALSSASEILTDFPDLTTGERGRFDRIVTDEARELTKIGEALASYFDKSISADRTLTPQDEVDALFRARANRFEEIDEAAEALHADVEGTNPQQRRTSARALAAAVLQPVVNQIIDGTREVETETGQARADAALLDYAASAILLPRTRFAREAEARTYDIEQLCSLFHAEFATICQRLTALDPDQHPRFGYLCANAAGNLLENIAIEGLALPRFGLGCPLWILYRAQAIPDVIHPQYVVFPGNRHFVFLARARSHGMTRFGLPRHFLTDMLTISTADAGRTIYETALVADAEEVGPGCRLCPRKTCHHRVSDPLLG
ncbi:MAG: short-chain fatty acyl-CoA regulator family protein, partial [Pseudomonadota bacterium]